MIEPLNVPTPFVPVCTMIAPEKLSPSPYPPGSHEELLKNSILKVALGALVNTPETEPFPDAEVTTG